MTQTVLIAGARGRFGSHAKEAFQAAGWDVRCLDRRAETLMEASKGADVIVNALNPPDYKNWETEIPRITREVIAAAGARGATVLCPGNVYNFGVQTAPWSGATPQIACSRKGQIRVEMEAAYKASGVQTIILRSGDFIGAGATGTWLDLVMLKSIAKGKFVYPGDPGVAHAWGYLPDLGRACVALAQTRAVLPGFGDLAFPGYAVSGSQMKAALEEISGHSLTLSRMPWWPVRLASPFWALGRELLEMRYLWDHPHSLDGTAFSAVLPDFEATEFRDAMAELVPVDIDPNQSVVRTQSLA